MALKIVHLCDVHSAKNDDIPAAFAHTLVVDGGTYAIDLCTSCDNERFTPLVAFLAAFGLLTDGEVDPREAVAENLREMYGAMGQTSPAAPEKRQKRKAAREEREEPAERSESNVDTLTTSEEEQLVPEGRLQLETRNRLPLMRSILLEAPEGLSLRVAMERLDATEGQTQNALNLLRSTGHAEYIAQKWWAPENVSESERARLLAAREIVHARNATPRVCPVEGAEVSGSNAWEEHCVNEHGVRPAQLLGLTCPLDGESFSAPQVLGMHGRRQHDAVHTPQLFQFAEQAGDPLGLVAGIRKQYGSES
jgi:hypothetical protein